MKIKSGPFKGFKLRFAPRDGIAKYDARVKEMLRECLGVRRPKSGRSVGSSSEMTPMRSETGVKAIKVPSRFYSMAKARAERNRRSVPMQVQYWAEIGCVIEDIGVTKEQLVEAATTLRERHQGRATPALELLSEIVRTFQAPEPAAEAEFRELIAAERGPVYGTSPEHPGKIVERRPDGSEVAGTLRGRQFIPDEAPAAQWNRIHCWRLLSGCGDDHGSG